MHRKNRLTPYNKAGCLTTTGFLKTNYLKTNLLKQIKKFSFLTAKLLLFVISAKSAGRKSNTLLT
jgi:hypothetical protein